MNIAIIGGGFSGVLVSLLLKKSNKNINVTIYEKENKLLKKLLVTGNGRCNLGNVLLDKNSYNNEKTFKIYEDFNYKEQIRLLNSFGIYTKNINNLYYPFSLSAKNLCENLLFLLNYYKVNLKLGYCFLDYKRIDNKYFLYFQDKLEDISYDYIIFTCGGLTYYKKSYENSVFKILEKHNYKINELKVGLNAIKVKENVKTLENVRVKCIASLVYKNKIIYQERGEVIFKKEGLSGICIFNILSIIQRNNLQNDAIVSLNLTDGLEDLYQISDTVIFKYNFLEGLFDKKLSIYVKKYCEQNELDFIYALKNLVFTYKEPYDFNSGQVCIGGISYSNLNDNNFSLIEKNVGFAGEILDSDGLCGGYNLMFCFASSVLIVKEILNIKKI